MTIEFVKQEAKSRYGKELTDEQAQDFLDRYGDGKLSDEELENVAGGKMHMNDMHVKGQNQC